MRMNISKVNVDVASTSVTQLVKSIVRNYRLRGGKSYINSTNTSASYVLTNMWSNSNEANYSKHTKAFAAAIAAFESNGWLVDYTHAGVEEVEEEDDVDVYEDELYGIVHITSPNSTVKVTFEAMMHSPTGHKFGYNKAKVSVTKLH